jgi:hypothetical protein
MIMDLTAPSEIMVKNKFHHPVCNGTSIRGQYKQLALRLYQWVLRTHFRKHYYTSSKCRVKKTEATARANSHLPGLTSTRHQLFRFKSLSTQREQQEGEKDLVNTDHHRSPFLLTLLP